MSAFETALEAGAIEPVEPAMLSLTVNDVPQLCGPEARAAAQTANDLIDEITSETTFNNWLDE